MLGESDLQNSGRATDGIHENQATHWPRDSEMISAQQRLSAAENASNKLPSYEKLMEE